MTDKNKADQQASPNSSTRPDHSSTSAQRARLLARLKLGPIDTITARRVLNILMPAARIKELKERGHAIDAVRISKTDDQGRTHHGIAQYYLAGPIDQQSTGEA
ncbi:helix-turn-helix domain-containing protein [Pseudomonas sp. P66]|uniref:Helix-turn-helix domain-containing protein n=1 Tax=Pseudomonas arcuscaelestis TaxID=2710591 RepID=A0ABS2BV82_9PSED|nr:helix-turn-helix domain-containing protein [Pseudomonas arcuscaelestis]MBM5457545.1 helix-turn-helix domain-containing protein [Pseudomonas arcuscaelestis]